MERHHRQPPAGAQQLLGGGKTRLQFVEFGVDVDADRLERARGGVLGRAGPMPQRLADDVRQFAGGGQRPRRHNRASDAARLALLAITEQHVGDGALVRGIDEIGGAGTFTLHPHVERSVAGKGEAARGLVELHRGDADIHGDPGHLRDSGIGQRRDHFRKAARMQHQPRRVLAGFRPALPGGDGIGIAVEGMDDGAGIEQGARIAAGAEGRIDDDRAGDQSERHQHFVAQHGNVCNFAHFLLSSPLRKLAQAALATAHCDPSCCSSTCGAHIVKVSRVA